MEPKLIGIDRATGPDKQVNVQFEVLGYFEDVFDLDAQKSLGTRKVENPDPRRVCGFHGKMEETVTVPLLLNRGHKQIVVPASPSKPLRIQTTLQRICGRAVFGHPMDKPRA
jgi:hypothetical protein